LLLPHEIPFFPLILAKIIIIFFIKKLCTVFMLYDVMTTILTKFLLFYGNARLVFLWTQDKFHFSFFCRLIERYRLHYPLGYLILAIRIDLYALICIIFLKFYYAWVVGRIFKEKCRGNNDTLFWLFYCGFSPFTTAGNFVFY
jgi:hypothetical protein